VAVSRRQYNQMLDTFDDVEYIGRRVLGSMSQDELRENFGIGEDLPPGALPRPGHTPIHWRKNPGYDETGALICPGCKNVMTVAASEKDGHTHAVCATGGCELYGRDYVAGSETQNPHRHSPASFDASSGRYICGCGEAL